MTERYDGSIMEETDIEWSTWQYVGSVLVVGAMIAFMAVYVFVAITLVLRLVD